MASAALAAFQAEERELRDKLQQGNDESNSSIQRPAEQALRALAAQATALMSVFYRVAGLNKNLAYVDNGKIRDSFSIRQRLYGGFNSSVAGHRQKATKQVVDRAKEPSWLAQINNSERANMAVASWYVCPGGDYVSPHLVNVNTIEIELDHKRTVAQHWNSGDAANGHAVPGRGTTQEDRQTWVSLGENLFAMCQTCNASRGSDGEDGMNRAVLSGFDGP